LNWNLLLLYFVKNIIVLCLQMLLPAVSTSAFVESKRLCGMKVNVGSGAQSDDALNQSVVVPLPG
jgi:hypothetical protein